MNGEVATTAAAPHASSKERRCLPSRCAARMRANDARRDFSCAGGSWLKSKRNALARGQMVSQAGHLAKSRHAEAKRSKHSVAQR